MGLQEGRTRKQLHTGGPGAGSALASEEVLKGNEKEGEGEHITSLKRGDIERLTLKEHRHSRSSVHLGREGTMEKGQVPRALPEGRGGGGGEFLRRDLCNRHRMGRTLEEKGL